jgi:hypothetical protein
LASCVPHPMVTRNDGPSGILSSSPDPAQIRVGVTNRTEIMQAFDSINTGLESPRVFFGRWAHSGMGVSGGRLWGERNLLVKFNDAGVVEKINVCGNDGFLKLASSYLDASELSRALAVPLEDSMKLEEFTTTGEHWNSAKIRITQSEVTIRDIAISKDHIRRILSLSLPEEEYSHPNSFFLLVASKNKRAPDIQVLLSAKTAAVMIAVLTQGKQSKH